MKLKLNDEKLPFVSIIIPAFNEERHIASSLQSVLSQNWPADRMEIIVVDNGSTDKTVEIASNLIESIGRGKVIRKVGGSIASVRNAGWRHSKGDILAFLDGDSVAQPMWLLTGYSLMQSFVNSFCVGFCVKPPLRSDSWVERTWHPISSSGKHKGTREVAWLSSFNLILARSAFEKINGFDESLVTCEDVDLGYRLSTFSKIILSDLCYVQHLDTTKTLLDFFKKEYWRGQSAVQSMLNKTNTFSQGK